MKDKYLIIATVVVIGIAIATIISYLKKSIYKKMLIAMQMNNHTTFLNLTNSKLTQFLYSMMWIDSMRLEEAIMRNNKKDVAHYLDNLSKQKLSEKNAEKVYGQAFNYYLSIGDTVMCTKWYEKIKELKNDRFKREFDRSYNIYVEKGYKFLEDMLNEIEYMEPSKAGVHEYLISLMYANKGDAANAKKYKKLSEEHLQQLDEEIKEKHKK